jgi:hypothetical protein
MAAKHRAFKHTALREALRRGAAQHGPATRPAAATPTPPPVAVSLEETALPPISVQPVVVPEPEPAPPRGLRRLAMTVAALGLFVGAALAAGGAPRAAADPGAPAAPPVAATAPPPRVDLHPEDPGYAPPPAPPSGPRADAHVVHTGHASIPGGILFMPQTFASADGAYDLYLHFHGNTRVVAESAEVAGVNAVVAVVNLGVNSGPYLDAYEEPGTYERLLASIDRAVGERGLEHPHLRRVAWGSWSGGYGAISRIFELGRGLQTLDAIFVLDGIHCGFLEDNRVKALDVRIIAPFLDMAKQAAEGKFLFSITHSEIDPGAYAGTWQTAAYLLDAVGGTPGEPEDPPEHVTIRAAEGAVSKKLEKRMEPTYEARVGFFHVRGYRGNTPEHHMAHLLQMGATAMPELAERWRTAYGQ